MPAPETLVRLPWRAVLFDLDGVLVDSFEVWFAVVNAARRRFGFPEVSRTYVASIFGQGIDADTTNLYPGRTRSEVERAYAEGVAEALHRMTVHPEAAGALAALGAAGIRRAVVTNTQDGLAQRVVAAAGLAAHLDFVIGVSPEVREKPAPDLLLRALGHFDIPPSEALMLGDSDYDAEAARRAGVAFRRFEIRRGASLAAELGVGLR